MPAIPGSFGRFSGPLDMTTNRAPHPVATIGGHDPSTLFLAPGYVFDLSLKAGVAIQIEFCADAPRMGQDFQARRSMSLRDVAGLLKQRQIDIGLDIALRAGIPIQYQVPPKSPPFSIMRMSFTPASRRRAPATGRRSRRRIIRTSTRVRQRRAP